MDFIYGYMPDFIKQIPLYMDFEGQKRAEKTFQVIILLFAGVGFVWGYLCQQFSQTIYILLAGFLLASLMTLPPWPMYRRNQLRWQPARDFADDEEDTSARQGAASSTGGSKGRRKK